MILVRVQKEIDEKTTVDDRRHTGMTNAGNVIVNMTLSYSDLYRTCVYKAD